MKDFMKNDRICIVINREIIYKSILVYEICIFCVVIYVYIYEYINICYRFEINIYYFMLINVNVNKIYV